MHDGFHAVALIGLLSRDRGLGGENLSGGCANGTPRNWFIAPIALGKSVAFPMIAPDSTVTVGAGYPLEQP